LLGKRAAQPLGQHHHAVFVALARSDDNLRPSEVDICNAQGAYFRDAHQENQRTGKSTLRFHPDWRVLDWGEIVEAPAAGTPGLQLADILVGSFSQAVDKRRHRGCNPEYAKQFFHRMARNAKRRHAHFGVTIWPFPLTKGRRAPLDPDQEEILRFYGFDNEALGRPGPTSSAR
jgi:hypothetical protein